MSPPPDSWFVLVERQIADLQNQFVRMEGLLDENTSATKRIESNTEGVVEAFSALAGGFKVLETIGKIAKPVAFMVAILTGMAGLWLKFKDSLITYLSR